MKIIKPIFFLLMEDISDWPEVEQLAVGKLCSIWFYNDNERTYCCELAPSIEGRYLGFVTQNEVSDDLHNMITDSYSEIYVNYWHENNLPNTITSHSDYELDIEEGDEVDLRDHLFEEYICNQVWFPEWDKVLGEASNITV